MSVLDLFSGIVAHANGLQEQQSERTYQEERRRSGNSGEALADAKGDLSRRLPQRTAASQSRPEFHGPDGSVPRRAATHWNAEPRVGRVDNGVSNRMDRNKSLGNTVLLEFPEIIGTAIMGGLML